MPRKLRPGTPSIGEGVRTPCQWIELGSLRRLVTASVSVSPSRQRKMGAGAWPLTPVAMAWRPLIVSGTGSIASANSVPLRTGARLVAACAVRRGQGASESAPAVVTAFIKGRLEDVGGG